ncbi:MAG: protein kinase domain-containing protein, partial [Gemmatimonadaceae bacterium]
MRCPRCGKTFDAVARFCTEDGARLAPEDGIAQAPAGPSTGAGAAPDPPQGVPPADLSRLTGRVLDGRYRVSRKVGEGGMAYVYEASDVAAKERVAIKVLTPRLSADRNAMARLRREASLGGRLSHPNVCHIIRLGESADGLVYIVMP